MLPCSSLYPAASVLLKIGQLISTEPTISGTGARTVEAWIRTTANCDPNNGGKQKTITDWGTFSTGARYTFNVLFSNAIRIEVGGSGLSGHKAVNDGNWHHVACVFDPNATYKYRLVVDGKVDTFGNIATTINTGNTIPMMIGQRTDNANLFEGDIDEVRVFDFARTDSAISADMGMEYCKLPGGLVAYYKLNEGTPESNNSTRKTAVDYTSSKKNGVLTNFALSGSSSNWVNGPNLLGGDSRSTLQIFECSSYVFPSGKNTAYFSGTFFDTIPNFYTCDSIITIKLTIGNSNKTVNQTSCDSFKSPSGKVYYTSGIYSEKFVSSRGCDSIVRYDLTILNSTESWVQTSGCDSVVSSSNKVYRSSGKYDEMFQSQIGCDSLVHLDLTIHPSYMRSDTVGDCDSVFAYNNWYKSSGKYKVYYQSFAGCDSVIDLSVHISPSDYAYSFEVTCDSFTSPGGITYRSGGNYFEKYTNIGQCDSVLEYELIIHPSYHITDTMHSCGPAFVHGKTFANSGDYSILLTTEFGCDSSVNLNLKVTLVDTTIKRTGNTLEAIQTGAAYTWLDCGTMNLVPGATSRTFTPEKNGTYAAIIEWEQCKDTSSCYAISSLGWNRFTQNVPLLIYPNPGNGLFHIQLPGDSKLDNWMVTDVNGKVIASMQQGPSEKGLIQLNAAPGIYYLKVYSGNSVYSSIIEVN